MHSVKPIAGISTTAGVCQNGDELGKETIPQAVFACGRGIDDFQHVTVAQEIVFKLDRYQAVDVFSA